MTIPATATASPAKVIRANPQRNEALALAQVAFGSRQTCHETNRSIRFESVHAAAGPNNANQRLARDTPSDSE